MQSWFHSDVTRVAFFVLWITSKGAYLTYNPFLQEALNLFYFEIRLKSVPGTSQYKAMMVKFLDKKQHWESLMGFVFMTN